VLEGEDVKSYVDAIHEEQEALATTTAAAAEMSIDPESQAEGTSDLPSVPTTAPGEGAAAAEGGDQEGGEDDAQPAAMEEG